MHYVYILKCADDSYYVGMTANLERRVKEHQKGYRDSSYTSTRRPVELVWSRELATRAEAVQFEQRVKGWPRARKEALIRGEGKDISGGGKQNEKPSKTGKKHADMVNATKTTKKKTKL